MSGETSFVYVVPSKGGANKEVAGEYFYQQATLQLLPRLPTSGDPVEAVLNVELVPEKDNPHDRRAISVRANGKVLGYLSRGMAAEYALPVQRVVASGASVRTSASVYAYVHEWKGEAEVILRVALPEPEMFTPLNQHYPTNTAVLPFGRPYQVTKEEDHFDHLFDYLPTSGTGMVLLTMHRKESMLKNGAVRELVELRLDGERVGELTNATSQHYLPLIRHAADKERTLGIWSKLTGSGVAAELTIHGLKASEVSDDWLTEMPVVPRLVPEAHSYNVPPAYLGEVREPKPKRSAPRPETANARSTAYATFSEPTTSSDHVPPPNASAHGGPEQQPTGAKTEPAGLTAAERKLDPRTHRARGIAMLLGWTLLGLLCSAIPGIGPVLLIAAIVVGIVANTRRRRVARILERAHAHGDTPDRIPDHG